jgi:hypothetical protein
MTNEQQAVHLKRMADDLKKIYDELHAKVVPQDGVKLTNPLNGKSITVDGLEPLIDYVNSIYADVEVLRGPELLGINESARD